MGTMTRAQIISEGMLLAGRDDLSARCQTWLQTWLDSVAASWPWPQLMVESSSIPVPTGSTSIDIGEGVSGGSSYLSLRRVAKIMDNAWIYTSDKRTMGRIRVRYGLSRPSILFDTNQHRGLPTSIRIRQGPTKGKKQWTLELDPFPDRDYLLFITYHDLGDVLASDSDILWYPNDATAIELIAAKCASYDDGEESPAAQARMAVISSLVSQDRVKYGAIPGVNDRIRLDPNVFGVEDEESNKTNYW